MAYEANTDKSTQASPLEQVLIWVRQDLVGELEAINQYQLHIDNIDNQEIKDLLAHIRDDEKEHVAELTHLITRIDAIQNQKFTEDHTAGGTGEHAEASAPAARPAATVGSLFGVAKR